MSWQTPDGEGPPESAEQPPDGAPGPDAETARFPVAETPPSEPPPDRSVPPSSPDAAAAPDTAPPLTPESPEVTPDASPPAGIISAAPVGWTAPPADPATGTAPDGPIVPWSAPSAPPVVAVTGAPGAVEGVVIARVFPRVVAYFVDGLLLGALSVAVGAAVGLYDADRDQTLAFIVGAVLVVVDLVYFVGLWTSGLQATVGMRLLRLRVLDATSAGTLPINDALLRWIALTGAISILGLVPGIDAYIGLIGAIWLLVLLITTASDRLRQGLHDKWARSVVVQPAPGGTGLAIATCLVLIVLLGLVLPIAGLALFGDQLRDILVQIGNSV
jgi:uncharacterized RDD family membrane protein YckC